MRSDGNPTSACHSHVLQHLSPINRVSELDPSISFDRTDSGAEILVELCKLMLWRILFSRHRPTVTLTVRDYSVLQYLPLSLRGHAKVVFISNRSHNVSLRPLA